MLAIVPLVTLLAQFVPMLSTAPAVAAAVDAVVALAPVLVKTFPALVETVKGIISTLRGNDLVSPEQLDALDKAEAIIDADWSEALAAARAEDSAAAKPST